jgi:O-antigen ligase
VVGEARISFLVTIASGLLGAAIWSGIGDRSILAVTMVTALVVLAVISPTGALGAVVLAVPTAFDIHPFAIGSFSLLEIGIVTSAAGLALRTASGGLTAIRRAIVAIAAPIEIVLPALLLLLASLLAYRTLPDDAFPAEALREIRLVIVDPLVFLLCALMIFRDRAARRYVWGCAVAIGAIIGAVACLELATGTGDVVGDAIMRATATYSHPNNLALFIERMLLLTLPCALRFRRSGFLWACVGLQGAGVVSTFSRGALVAVVVGTAAAMLMMRMRRELLWMGGLVIAGGLVLVAIARDRILDAGGSGSEPTRFAIWRSAIQMGLDHPVFGVGPDQFLYQYSRRYIEPAAWPERYTSHPHNLALDVWLRLGVAGIASFIAVVAGIILRVSRALPTIRRDAIAVGGLSALVGGLAHGMFDNGFFLPDLAVLTWLAVAFLVTADPGPRNLSA